MKVVSHKQNSHAHLNHLKPYVSVNTGLMVPRQNLLIIVLKYMFAIGLFLNIWNWRSSFNRGNQGLFQMSIYFGTKPAVICKMVEGE